MHICRILLLSHKVHCLLPNKLWICSYLSNIFTLEFPLRCPFGGFVFRSKWRGVLSRLYHWSEKKAQKKDGVLFLWIHWKKRRVTFTSPIIGREIGHVMKIDAIIHFWRGSRRRQWRKSWLIIIWYVNQFRLTYYDRPFYNRIWKSMFL